MESVKERRATLMHRLTVQSAEHDLNFFKNSAFVKSRNARKWVQRCMHVFAVIFLATMALILILVKFSDGLQNVEQLLFSVLLAMWIALYLFFEWRGIIQSHVHFILS